MTFKHTASALITATLLFSTAPSATAQTAPAAAKPGDKAMTCADIAAERTAINDAVAAGALKKQKSAKVKKGLFGFAKTFASLAIPGATAGLGGGSMIGSIAAQTAGQTASNAVSSAEAGDGAVKEARPTDQQQARLDRLDSIGAYRQCGA